MTRRYWYSMVAVVLTATILAGSRYVSHAPPGRIGGAGQNVIASYSPAVSNGDFQMPTSAGEVHVTAWIGPGRAPSTFSTIFTRLDIKPGWHVNANPASLPFLISTVESATIEGTPAKLNVIYPQGRNSRVVLQSTAIRVYDDGTILKASIPPQTFSRLTSAGNLTLAVTVQSCSNKGICLPPATLVSNLP